MAIKVLKFGGTSVGTADNMRRVADIIVQQNATVTVLSAMSGTTDFLITISKEMEKENKKSVQNQISILKKRYYDTIDKLIVTESLRSQAEQIVSESIDFIESNYKMPNNEAIIAQGEIMTSSVFCLYLQERGINAKLISAFDFMIKDDKGAVDRSYLSNYFSENKLKENCYYITQGFIALSSDGKIDNLGRGGSDYSAALIGAALHADEVQIWTDIDGIHNNDPRYVEGTYPIRQMSFDEAAELAYFGAKILHPATIQPCKDYNIAVRLKNTMQPEAEGTLIYDYPGADAAFHAVAAKDGITVIRITSARMLMAYGFLKGVFEVFEKYHTPIDMITTSEVAVAITIDDTSHLEQIITELKKLGTIDVENNNSIVSIVGRIEYGHSGLICKVLDSLTEIPIKMISYGASHRSISLLVDTSAKIETLQSLNKHLFKYV